MMFGEQRVTQYSEYTIISNMGNANNRKITKKLTNLFHLKFGTFAEWRKQLCPVVVWSGSRHIGLHSEVFTFTPPRPLRVVFAVRKGRSCMYVV
jgi:hypothetical protein